MSPTSPLLLPSSLSPQPSAPQPSAPPLSSPPLLPVARSGTSSSSHSSGDDDMAVEQDAGNGSPPPRRFSMRLRSQSGVNRASGGDAIVKQLRITPGSSLLRAELHRAFDEFSGDKIFHIVWGARAIEGFQLSRTRLFGEIRSILNVLLIEQQPLEELMRRCDLMLKRDMTVVQWIASLACLRRVFTRRLVQVEAVKKTLAENSVHFDTRLQTQVGTVFIRNSQNKNKAGTTRMYIIASAGNGIQGDTPVIFDPSYSEIRNIVEGLDPALSMSLARIMLRWSRERSTELDSLMVEVCDRRLSCSGKVFSDIARPIPGFKVMSYCRNRINTKESKHLLSGFTEQGKRAITFRLGDLLSLFWAILFLAEGRHSPLVADYNLALLDLVAEGHIGLADCLATISHTKNKQKIFPAFTGGMFPSHNFAEFGNPAPHQQRYVILNRLSGLDGSLVEEAEGLTSIDESIDSRDDIRKRLREWFVDNRQSLDPAELFVLYKISFIEFLRAEVFRRVAPLPSARPELSDQLEAFAQRLRGFLQLQAMRKKFLAVQPLPGVTQGSVSQFAVPGGSVACSAMATLAIAHLFDRNGEVSSASIDNVLLEGALLYQEMADSADEQQELMQAMALSAHGEPHSAALLGSQPHFHPAEIPGEELVRRGVKRGKTQTYGAFMAVMRAQIVLASAPRAAITLVAGGYTISVTRVGDHIYVFDSHGWRAAPNAFIRVFNMSEMTHLCTMLESMLGDRVGGSLLDHRERLRKTLGNSPFSRGLAFMKPKPLPALVIPSESTKLKKNTMDAVDRDIEDFGVDGDVSVTIYKPMD